MVLRPIRIGILAMLVFPNAATTHDVVNAPSRHVPTTARSSIESTLDEQRTSGWGLNSEEWTRYRELMRGPLGVYSPNLDPLTALGIEARTQEERVRYAQLQVRLEARRVEKLLAYQRAYDAAWKRLYPALERVRRPGGSASAVNAANPSARLAVFVRDNCPACETRVRALQASGRAFDLYMVGTRGEDAVIRRWATRVAIDPAKVRARTITLNHDAGRWLSLAEQGELPAVLHEVNGRWQRE